MLTATILLFVTAAPEPRYRAVFVDLDKTDVVSEVEIFDAKKDLSAVGVGDRTKRSAKHRAGITAR